MNCQGTKFAWCSSSVITTVSSGPEVLKAPRVGDEVDRLGRAAGEDHLALGRRVDEGGDGAPGALVPLGRALGEPVDATMDVRVLVLVERAHPVEHLPRLLRRRRRVEVRERLAADELVEEREVRAQSGGVERARGADGHHPIVAGRVSPTPTRAAGRSGRRSARGSRSRSPHPSAISTSAAGFGTASSKKRRRPGTSEDDDVDRQEARAQDADEPRPPRARRLERQDEVEADHDQRRGRSRARLQQPEVEDVDARSGRSSSPRGPPRLRQAPRTGRPPAGSRRCARARRSGRARGRTPECRR